MKLGVIHNSGISKLTEGEGVYLKGKVSENCPQVR